MRVSLAATLLAVAALAGLAFLPTVSSGPVDSAGTTSHNYTAAPETHLRYYVPDGGAFVALTVRVTHGTMHTITVSGPGGCTGTHPAADGTALTLNCGWLRAGDGWLSLKVDGVAVGSVSIQGGAYFPPVG